jgi:2,4-dienoyl-CoA reductase-like NADH-dependent reductase (Old Yellow Enzyme family)
VRSRDPNWAPPGPYDSPSGLSSPGHRFGEPMSDAAVADTIAAFATAASEARRLGFDAVELHGAHGYLIDQFFWSETNLRTDAYGGKTLKERSRFAVEVARSVREAVGPEFPIGIRVSQWKQQDYSARLAETPDALADWLVPIVEAGVDLLHCSQRRFWQAEFPEVDGESGLNLAGWAKKLTGAATISVGSVGLSGDVTESFSGKASSPANLDNLNRRVEAGEFDLVAVGRALLGDPYWARKVSQGEPELDFNPADFARLT